jgi:homoaconitase/3-isopropylmalate dehydratase large subunit
MVLLADAVLALKSDAQVNISGEDVTTIVWVDGNPTGITNQQILDKYAELQADYDAKEYQRNRKAEYPSIEDQLDDIYHNGIDGWKTTIKVTKDKYPKS